MKILGKVGGWVLNFFLKTPKKLMKIFRQGDYLCLNPPGNTPNSEIVYYNRFLDARGR